MPSHQGAQDTSAHTYRLLLVKDQAGSGDFPGNTGKEARLYNETRERQQRAIPLSAGAA